MRLTKRQLKRIIREEYSRLKRRGLIKEAFESDHEQDEFLAEQIHQYEGEICQAIVQCAMQGYMEQEDNPDSDSPEAAVANTCMMGEANPGELFRIATRCAPFASVLDMMKEEQESMFGMTARNTEIFSLMYDMGIVEMCCEDFQSQVGGY